MLGWCDCNLRSQPSVHGARSASTLPEMGYGAHLVPRRRLSEVLIFVVERLTRLTAAHHTHFHSFTHSFSTKDPNNQAKKETGGSLQLLL
jgi:hypothetical protein